MAGVVALGGVHGCCHHPHLPHIGRYRTLEEGALQATLPIRLCSASALPMHIASYTLVLGGSSACTWLGSNRSGFDSATCVLDVDHMLG